MAGSLSVAVMVFPARHNVAVFVPACAVGNGKGCLASLFLQIVCQFFAFFVGLLSMDKP